jgi:FixJ family two-component response regulator
VTMRVREELASRPVVGSMFVVMACSDMQEADEVGRCLSDLKTGCLITYLKAEDLALNAPSGTVALVILATDDSSVVLGKTLDWLRHRWPRCPITVVGDVGCGEHEMAAREGGATFLTRPVSPGHWLAILSHAFSKAQQGQPSTTPDGQCVPAKYPAIV